MISDNKTLFLDGKQFLFGKLKDENPLDQSPNGRDVIKFCKQWLAGSGSFEAMTSGSTGLPKKVSLIRDQMVASALLTQGALGLKEGLTALLCLDPNLIAGKMMMVRSLVTGMHLVVTNPTANPFDHIPADLHVDFAAMVPLQARTIISSGKYRDFLSIGKVLLGGGAVPTDLHSYLQKLSTEFYATYGMTETVSHVALQKLNGPDRTEYFGGLKGVSFSVDERNCLVIHAPHLGGQPIVTNDFVKLLTPQRFVWLGRWDNVINSGGVKIIPEELELQIGSYLSAEGFTNNFFVTSRPHQNLGEEVVLVVEGNWTEEEEKIVLSHLKESTEKYKAPKQVLYVPRFELTTTGKIKRRESAAIASPRPGQ